MAEPDGNPPPSPPTPPAKRFAPRASEASAVPSPEWPETLTPAPRVNPPSVFNPKETPLPPAAPAGFNDLLAWMQAFGGNQPAPPPAAEPSVRTPLSRKEKKFHRQDPEVSRNNEKTGETGQPSTGAGGTGRSELLPTLDRVTVRKRRLRPASVAGSPSIKWLRGKLFLLALLAGAFVFGRVTANKRNPVAVSAGPRATLDRAEPGTRVPGLIDEAMTAEANLDFVKASDLLQQVQGEKSRAAGIDFHLALLSFEQGELPRALAQLNRSIEKGEEVAACYNLRGTLKNRTNGVEHGLDDLEVATQVDPFNARYFYFLGEALRRGGQPQAALKRLRQATDRLRDPVLKSLYDLKVRLAQIESGRESEFADQLAAELRRTPASIDWLFTAAAVEMHRGHFDTAAGFLDETLALADRDTVNIRLRDYFFHGFANEKSLARFYAPTKASDDASPSAATPIPSPAAIAPIPLPPPLP